MIRPGTEAGIRRLLARNIRLLRAMRGWSQEQLAEASGLHRTYVGTVERCESNVGIDALTRLATALGVPVAVLVTEDHPLNLPSPPPAGIREAVARYRGRVAAPSRAACPRSGDPGNVYRLSAAKCLYWSVDTPDRSRVE